MTMKTGYHLIADTPIILLTTIICFLPLFVLIGAELKNIVILNTGKLLLRIIACTIILTTLSIALPSYFLSDVAPKRACELGYLFIAISVFVSAIIIGNNINLAERRKIVLKYSSVALIFIFILTNAVIQIPIATAYTKADDARIKMLKQEKGVYTEKVLALAPLPPSGMLYSSEISTDTAYWTNKHLELGLQLNFKVVRKN